MSIFAQVDALASASNSTPVTVNGPFNLTITGVFVGTLTLQRRFFTPGVGWGTFVNVSRDITGTAATFTAPASLVISEPEVGVQYQVAMAPYTSGTATVRISQ